VFNYQEGGVDMNEEKNRAKEKSNSVSELIEGIELISNETDKKRKTMVQRLKILIGEMELALKKRGKKITSNKS
jgi:hypothetical protein